MEVSNFMKKKKKKRKKRTSLASRMWTLVDGAHSNDNGVIWLDLSETAYFGLQQKIVDVTQRKASPRRQHQIASSSSRTNCMFETDT
jgi:hypothetical protein